MQRSLEEKVFSFLEEHHMIQAGDHVVAGVSGGADSVCLFFVLLEYQKRVPFSLKVVHVNHGIREDAAEDAGYVEELCREHEIPYVPVQVDVKAQAKILGVGQEEAGRCLRYEAFAGQAGEKGLIAVAHNANDRAETFLFHLFRGSNIRGLSGIQPVRDGVIRPLLCVERSEIESYLSERGIAWREDSTNGEDAYTRNRIRHHILPVAEGQICNGSVRHICNTADELGQIEDYLKQETRAAEQTCLERDREGRRMVFCVEELLKQHIVIRKRLIMEAILEFSPRGRDIGAVHVEQVLGLLTARGSKEICLPFGIQAVREYERLILKQVKPEREGESPKYLENRLEYRLLERRIGEEIPQNEYTKWFDYDKINGQPTLRYRQTGDYLTIRSNRGEIIHKSLKDYMITEKIPKEQRDRIPVLAVGHHVIWLVGYRISEAFKVDENTLHILQVEWKERTEEKWQTIILK